MEPDAGQLASGDDRSAAARVRVFALAILLAAAGAFAAPRAWPKGAGEVVLAYQGEEMARGPVEVGAGRPFVLEGERGGLRARVDVAGGVRADKEVLALISLRDGDEIVQPQLQDVRLEVHLADGRSALVPARAWRDQEQVLEAARRPPVGAAVVLGLLGLVIVLWITEVVPLWVTALIVPVVLVGTGTGAKAALQSFADPIIALFFGGFLMAEAMRRVRLDHMIAVGIVARAGRGPITLFAAMMGVSAFLSMWMSNTAATAVLVPIAIAVTAPVGDLGFRKMVVLGIAYAATLGGVGSMVGTPANPIAVKFLNTFAGKSLSFVDWFPFGLPLVVLFLPVIGFWLWRRFHVSVEREKFAEVRREAILQWQRVRKVDRQQLTVLLVFAAVMALWLTQHWHGWNVGVIAVAGAVALALLGRLESEDLGRISWGALLTFGGGLTLGVFMTESGTSDWMAAQMGGLSGLPPALGVAAVALLALALTAVASNTATAAMLVPLAIPLAGVIGVDPVLLVVVVAIASSIDFALVIGTPPTMIAYSTRLFTVREIFRIGIVLDLLGVLVLVTVVLALWRVMGVV